MEEFHISEQDVQKFVDSYIFRRLPAHPCIFAAARRDPIADFTAGQMFARPPSAYYGFLQFRISKILIAFYVL